MLQSSIAAETGFVTGDVFSSDIARAGASHASQWQNPNVQHSTQDRAFFSLFPHFTARRKSNIGICSCVSTVHDAVLSLARDDPQIRLTGALLCPTFTQLLVHLTEKTRTNVTRILRSSQHFAKRKTCKQKSTQRPNQHLLIDLVRGGPIPAWT